MAMACAIARDIKSQAFWSAITSFRQSLRLSQGRESVDNQIMLLVLLLLDDFRFG